MQSLSYIESHPWLKFTVNWDIFSPFLWVALGQSQEICRQIGTTVTSPEVSTDIRLRNLARGVHSTLSIDENTLPYEDILQHIQGDLEIPGSKRHLVQGVDNILGVYELIVDYLEDGFSSDVNPKMLRLINKLVLSEMHLDDEIVPGAIRRVVVGRHRGAPVQDCKELLERMCAWLNGPSFAPNASAYTDQASFDLAFAILKAVYAHLYIVWIRPFPDGNGRTARLVELMMLISAGIPGPVAQLLTIHYNQTKAMYKHLLEASNKRDSGETDFVLYAVQGFRDQLLEYLKEVQDSNFQALWENFVYSAFKDKNKAGDIRRRELLIGMSSNPQGITIAEAPLQSVFLNKAYKGKTTKTISRDFNELKSLGLVTKKNGRWVPNYELLKPKLTMRTR